MVLPDCFQLDDVRRLKALDMARLAREVYRAAQAGLAMDVALVVAAFSISLTT